MQSADDEDDEEPVRKRLRGNVPKGKTLAAIPVNLSAKKGETKDSTQLKPRNLDSKGTKTSTKISKPLLNPQNPSSPASGDGRRNTKRAKSQVAKENQTLNGVSHDKTTSEVEEVEEKQEEVAVKDEMDEEEDEEDENGDSDEDKPEVAAKAREKVQSTLKSHGKDPYPDWPSGSPVPYAALCTTFSLIEMTTKRLIISAHCLLLLRQILRLTPQDLLPTVQLMINKLAADYAGIELGIGESLIMKAIGETTGRSLQVIKADQNEIGDLGLVAAKSRSNQPTMFKPKALTVRGVHDGLMNIAIISGDGSQGRKVAGIKKLLSAADASLAGKGSKGIDITKDKGGASEAKFIIRFLEGKLRLGLAEKTVLVALAHAMVIHETESKGSKVPSADQLAKGEAILKSVYRYWRSGCCRNKADNKSTANCRATR